MENKTPFMTEIPEQEPQRQQYFMAHAKEQLHILEENLGRPLTCCINTFGCQMNAKDSEKLLGILEKIGYEETDDEKAAVGSINLDFRSLYLHFECGTYLYRNSTVADVEKDFENTLEKCIPVTLKDCAQYNWFGTKAGRFLRLIAPLM